MKKPIDPNLNGDIDLDLNANGNNTQKNNGSVTGDDELKLSFEAPPSPDRRRTYSSSSGHSSHSSHSAHRSHSHRHHHRHRRKKKRLNGFVRFLIVLVSLILVFSLAIGGTFFYLDRKGKDDITSVTTQASYDEVIEHNGHKYAYNKDVVAIAFIGVDKRNLEDGAQIGSAGQADADIVLTINTKSGKAKVIAVPRDTMVDVDLYDTQGNFLRSENIQLCLSFAYGNGKKHICRECYHIAFTHTL